MRRPTRRALASLALAAIAIASAVDCALAVAGGSNAPAWSHWWCSPAALRSASRGVGQGGPFGVLGLLRELAPHWPHILPVVIALATLVYLRRADARRAQIARAASGTVSAAAGPVV